MGRSRCRLVLESGQVRWKQQAEFRAAIQGFDSQFSVELGGSPPHVGEPMTATGFDERTAIVLDRDGNPAVR